MSCSWTSRSAQRAASTSHGVWPRSTGDVDVLFETSQPRIHIRRVRDFAHLTVVDDVDAGLELLRNTLRDRRPHSLAQRCWVDAVAAFGGVQQFDQVVRAGQAARVGGEYRVSTALHVAPRL